MDQSDAVAEGMRIYFHLLRFGTGCKSTKQKGLNESKGRQTGTVPYLGVFFLAESKGLSFWCLAGSEGAGTGRVWNIFDFGILRNKIFTYICTSFSQGILAQLVEQRTEKACVPGSIPGGTTSRSRGTVFVDDILKGYGRQGF